jgi:hypothetical protein
MKLVEHLVMIESKGEDQACFGAAVVSVGGSRIIYVPSKQMGDCWLSTSSEEGALGLSIRDAAGELTFLI